MGYNLKRIELNNRIKEYKGERKLLDSHTPSDE